MASSEGKVEADTTVAAVGYGDATKEQNESTTPVKAQRPAQSRKAALSAYMTIAAAAFGLISDGCGYKVLLFNPHCPWADSLMYRPEQHYDYDQRQASPFSAYLTGSYRTMRSRSNSEYHRSCSRNSIPPNTRRTYLPGCLTPSSSVSARRPTVHTTCTRPKTGW